MRRIRAEQRERNLAAEVVPHRFEFDRRADVAGIPQHRNHFAEHPDAAPGADEPADHVADLQRKGIGTGPVVDKEPREGLVGIERDERSVGTRCSQIDPSVGSAASNAAA